MIFTLPGLFCFMILYADIILRVGWNGLDFIFSKWNRPFLRGTSLMKKQDTFWNMVCLWRFDLDLNAEISGALSTELTSFVFWIRVEEPKRTDINTAVWFWRKIQNGNNVQLNVAYGCLAKQKKITECLHVAPWRADKLHWRFEWLDENMYNDNIRNFSPGN